MVHADMKLVSNSKSMHNLRKELIISCSLWVTYTNWKLRTLILKKSTCFVLSYFFLRHSYPHVTKKALFLVYNFRDFVIKDQFWPKINSFSSNRLLIYQKPPLSSPPPQKKPNNKQIQHDVTFIGVNNRNSRHTSTGCYPMIKTPALSPIEEKQYNHLPL